MGSRRRSAPRFAARNRCHCCRFPGYGNHTAAEGFLIWTAPGLPAPDCVTDVRTWLSGRRCWSTSRHLIVRRASISILVELVVATTGQRSRRMPDSDRICRIRSLCRL